MMFSAIACVGFTALSVLTPSAEAQFAFGKKSVYRIFEEGAEHYENGDYEKAKVCFDKVKVRENELKADQRIDLQKWIEFNNLALEGRQKYEATLLECHTAWVAGRMDEVRKCLNELSANPYGAGLRLSSSSWMPLIDTSPAAQAPQKSPAREYKPLPLPVVVDYEKFQTAQNKKAPPLPYIDAHVHVWTSDTTRYPLAPGYKKEDIHPASFTPEELFKHAKPAKVGRIALIQISSYGFDNSYMLDMIARHPDVFVGTALIDPYNEPERVMDKMAKQGVRAFRVQPKLSKEPIGRWLRPEGFARMFAAGARNNQAMSCLIDPDALPEVDRMCTAYPNTPVIIDHLARIGVDGMIRARDVDALCALARHKKVMVKIGAFYALGKKQAPYTDLGAMIEKVVKAFGAERCMWESDCPFQVEKGHTYQNSIDLIRTRLPFLSESDKDWLLAKTAERFFFGK